MVGIWYQDVINWAQDNWAPSSNTVVKTTTPAIATASVQLVAANPNRRGFQIWNNSSNSIYISWDSVSASSTPAIILAAFQSYSMTTGVIWTGPISGIRNAGSGTCTVWEFV